MDSSVSFRELRNVEDHSTSRRESVSSLESMFANNRSHSLNYASIEEVETRPHAACKLPEISPSESTKI
jgi:hypothetical protein